MQWVTYLAGDSGADGERVGLVEDGAIHGLAAGIALVDLLGDDGTALREAGERARRSPVEQIALDAAALCAPIPRPPTIRDFSAFEEHMRNGLKAIGQEMGQDWYEMPVFYFGNSSATTGPGEIVAPGNCERLDYELEVAAVVGRAGRDLDPSTAEDHIAGFCIFNDFSARDLQRRETACAPIGPAKGKDFANAFGPCLITRDELEPLRKDRAFDLAMVARVNGEVLSRGNLGDIYWSFGELLAYASRGASLVPGDLIGSGTCSSGCVLELELLFGDDAPPYLADGDVVELEVDGIGKLTNTVRFGPAPTALR